MTRPLYEPSVSRRVQSAGYGARQLFRRPLVGGSVTFEEKEYWAWRDTDVASSTNNKTTGITSHGAPRMINSDISSDASTDSAIILGTGDQSDLSGSSARSITLQQSGLWLLSLEWEWGLTSAAAATPAGYYTVGLTTNGGSNIPLYAIERVTKHDATNVFLYGSSQRVFSIPNTGSTVEFWMVINQNSGSTVNFRYGRFHVAWLGDHDIVMG